METVTRIEGTTFENLTLKDIRKLEEEILKTPVDPKLIVRQVIICSKKMQKIIEKKYGELVPRYFDYVINRPYKKYVRIMPTPIFKRGFDISSTTVV